MTGHGRPSANGSAGSTSSTWSPSSSSSCTRSPGETALSLARADQDVALYRCFLKLCALHPGTTIVPTRQLDHVWHTHMLDTAKYRADCDQVFGLFLDHFPYCGLSRGSRTGAPGTRTSRTPAVCSASTSASRSAAEPAASACRNHGDGADCCVGCIGTSDASARPRPDRNASAARIGQRKGVQQ